MTSGGPIPTAGVGSRPSKTKKELLQERNELIRHLKENGKYERYVFEAIIPPFDLVPIVLSASFSNTSFHSCFFLLLLRGRLSSHTHIYFSLPKNKVSGKNCTRVYF